MQLSALSDSGLVESLKRIVAREREATADVVEHLAEVDRRQLFLNYPCSSLSAYCVQALGYSDHAAAHRVTAARLIQRYPLVLEMLRSGQLHLSAVRTVGPVLNDDNYRDRLQAAVGKTRDELERLVAGWHPKPDVPTRIVPVKTAEPMQLLARMDATPVAEPVPVEQPLPAKPAPLPKPLSPERYKLEMTVSRETRDKLMRARDYLRHAVPDGDIAKIIERMADDFIARVEAKKFGRLKRTKPAAAQAEPQAKPAPQSVVEPDVILEDDIIMPRSPDRATRREVAERDGYQCCFVGEDGRRCTSTAWLEFDHIVEWSIHGPTLASNLRLLCSAHNQAKEKQRREARGVDAETVGASSTPERLDSNAGRRDTPRGVFGAERGSS